MKNIEWGEFKIGDLFEIQNTLSFNKSKLKQGFEYDYVTRTSQNQGILQETGFVNKKNINPSGIWSLGLLQMDFFYRHKPWYAGQFVRKIIPKFQVTRYSTIFFTIALNKLKKKLLTVLVRNVDKVFINSKIQLPTKNNKPDFDVMENLISELETQKIKELESYLSVSGLNDYTLTQEEIEILDNFENGNVEWGEFKIEDLLNWQSQKEIDPLAIDELKDEKEQMYPFYGQATINNGVISFLRLTNKVLNNPKGKPTILIHSNNQNIVYLETPFFLKDGHGATSVLQCEELNRLNQMFIIASIDKVIKHKYSYNNKATKIELKNTVIQLPTKKRKIDFDIMEILTSVIQKLVIKDVVLYTERKIH